MKILQVIEALPPIAGTSVFCVEIARQCVQQGHKCALAVKLRLSDEYSVPSEIPVFLISELKQMDWRPDVIHIHAQWCLQLSWICFWARLHGIAVVWSLHGALMPWTLKAKRLKKGLALLAYQYWADACANVLHTTAQPECQVVQHLFPFKKRIVEVPLGVNLPSLKDVQAQPIVLCCSRMHPLKGIKDLVVAWSQLPHNNWKLVLMGPSCDGYMEDVLQEVERLGIANSVEYVGPKMGVEKEAYYARAGLFILPSYSENFAAVIIEAMAFGVPVITTRATPWKEVETCQCGRWIENGVFAIAEVLKALMGLSDEARHAMGQRGRKLVEKKYTWTAIGKQMIDVYSRETK